MKRLRKTNGERRAAAVERLAAVRVEADLGVRVGEAAHVGVVVELLVDSMSFQDERAASAGSSAAFPRRVECARIGAYHAEHRPMIARRDGF